MIDLVHMWLQILQVALNEEDYDEARAVLKHILEEIYGGERKVLD
jgi:hypothetical protein